VQGFSRDFPAAASFRKSVIDSGLLPALRSGYVYRMSRPNSAIIADDEAHIRTYVRMILQQLGVEEIYESRTGNQVLTLYKEKRPDIVLLDINMPGLTGVEVLPNLMEIDPEAVVIMMTGHASRSLVESSARDGAVHYIRKDTPRDEIIRILGDLFKSIFPVASHES